MDNKLLKAVTNLGAPKILLVGDFLLDSYVYGDAVRISPEAPVQVLHVVDREYNCGGAGSVAMDLAALGAVPMCIGIIGDDRNAEVLKDLLAKSEINTNGLIKVSDRPTISKQRLIGLAQHRHRQQLLRIDDECTDPLSKEIYEKVLGAFRSQLADADVVCLQDYNKGVLSPEVCSEMIELASRAGKKILVDPPMSGNYSKYSKATLIAPNRKETSTAVGFDVNTIADAEKAAKILAEQHSLEAVVITLDKEGAYLWTRDSGEHIPTVPRSVYDVTGAGDMVLAMLAVAIAAGCDFRTAVQLSNIAGGIEVEKFGVATVTVDEIVNEIIAENKGKTGKIHTIDMLLNLLSFHRQQKQTVVFTNGCFDVLHTGHIEFLKFCKQQGDIVVIGLNSDSSVTNIKGPDRPINNQHDRAAVLAALEMVDFITVFNEPDPLRLIKQVKPNILVKGVDWAKKGVIGREFVEAGGGKVVLAEMVDGKSSTDTINKMKSLDK